MKDDMLFIIEFIIIGCFYLFIILNTYTNSIIRDCKEKGFHKIKNNKILICEVIIKD